MYLCGSLQGDLLRVNRLVWNCLGGDKFMGMPRVGISGQVPNHCADVCLYVVIQLTRYL